jgi:hypothetical protein
MFTKFFNRIRSIVWDEVFKNCTQDIRFSLSDEHGSELLCMNMHYVPVAGQLIYFGADVPNERAKRKTFRVTKVTECHNYENYRMHFIIDLEVVKED